MKSITALDIKIEDLSENHREYVKVIGMAAFLKLCEEFGGTPIYLPKSDEIKRPAVYRAIKEEYLKGKTTMRQLAYKYGVSESTVYRVAKGNLL